MTLEAKIRGIFVVFMLFWSSFFGAIFVGGTLLPVFFLRPQLYRVLFDFMVGSWECYTAVSILSVSGDENGQWAIIRVLIDVKVWHPVPSPTQQTL